MRHRPLLRPLTTEGNRNTEINGIGTHNPSVRNCGDSSYFRVHTATVIGLSYFYPYEIIIIYPFRTMRASCPVKLTLFDFIILINLGEGYNL
jgi:hypothetical protein